MVLFRQINTPRPEKWDSGRQWFVEDYEDNQLVSMWVVRRVLSPPVIQVKSVLKGHEVPQDTILEAIREKWPNYRIDMSLVSQSAHSSSEEVAVR